MDIMAKQDFWNTLDDAPELQRTGPSPTSPVAFSGSIQRHATLVRDLESLTATVDEILGYLRGPLPADPRKDGGQPEPAGVLRVYHRVLDCQEETQRRLRARLIQVAELLAVPQAQQHE